MLQPHLAVNALNEYGNGLRSTFGVGFRAEITSGNTVDDLITNLQNGYPTSIHISQDVNLFKPNGQFGDWRALIGGGPHTVTLAGYDANSDTWYILDPSLDINNSYREWHTPELMDKWGRQFLGYPPRFAMTTLIPDSTSTQSTIPKATPTPTSSQTPTQSTTPAPPPSQTVQPASKGSAIPPQ